MTTDTEGTTTDGTTRRDALKITGAAALGGMAAMLAGATALADPAGAATTTHVPTSVEVTLGGVAVPGIVSVDTLGSQYETTSSFEGGQWVESISGKASRIRIIREWSNDTTFIDLFQKAGSSAGGTAGAGQTMVVTVRGRHGSTAGVFTLSDCAPVEWDGPSYDAAAMKEGGAADRPTESLSFNFTKILY